jgi:hypothetical protein
LLGLGLPDAAAVIGLVIAQAKVGLDNFLDWEVEWTHRENDTESNQTQPA